MTRACRRPRSPRQAIKPAATRLRTNLCHIAPLPLPQPMPPLSEPAALDPTTYKPKPVPCQEAVLQYSIPRRPPGLRALRPHVVFRPGCSCATRSDPAVEWRNVQFTAWDDAYIHLSLAWTVSGPEPMASTPVNGPRRPPVFSGPFLLALFSSPTAGLYIFVPLLINVAAAFTTHCVARGGVAAERCRAGGSRACRPHCSQRD